MLALTARDGRARRLWLERGIAWYGEDLSWGGGRSHKARVLGTLVRRLRARRPDVLMPYCTRPNVLCGLVWRASGASLGVWNQRDVDPSRAFGLGDDPSRTRVDAARDRQLDALRATSSSRSGARAPSASTPSSRRSSRCRARGAAGLAAAAGRLGRRGRRVHERALSTPSRTTAPCYGPGASCSTARGRRARPVLRAGRAACGDGGRAQGARVRPRAWGSVDLRGGSRGRRWPARRLRRRRAELSAREPLPRGARVHGRRAARGRHRHPRHQRARGRGRSAAFSRRRVTPSGSPRAPRARDEPGAPERGRLGQRAAGTRAARCERRRGGGSGARGRCPRDERSGDEARRSFSTAVSRCTPCTGRRSRRS